MNVLIACESSGIVRDAFLARGHNAISCDLLPSERPGPHYQCDVRLMLHYAWDLIIAHPDCTYLSVSGMHWNHNPKSPRYGGAQTEAGLAFARIFLDGPETAHVPRVAVENPISIISTRVRKPDQIIQPYQFGHNASKATCLWLKGVAPLVLDPAARVPGRIVNGRERWANQTDSGQNRLSPGPQRWRDRSRTYGGIARAMALQWG